MIGTVDLYFSITANSDGEAAACSSPWVKWLSDWFIAAFTVRLTRCVTITGFQLALTLKVGVMDKILHVFYRTAWFNSLKYALLNHTTRFYLSVLFLRATSQTSRVFSSHFENYHFRASQTASCDAAACFDFVVFLVEQFLLKLSHGRHSQVHFEGEKT